MSFQKQPVAFTTGNLWVNIWQLSWPMLLIMIFNFFVGFTDVYVAGFINAEAQAAIGFVSQLYFLIIIIANSISIGTLALVSRAVGSGDSQKAVAIAKQSILFSIIVAGGLMFIGLVFYKEIISLAGFPLEIRAMSENFLRIFALALGFNYIVIVSNAIFRASGEVIKPLVTMFLVSIINVAGDFVFVFGIYPFPKLGYIGIALSTAISVTIGMIINLRFFSLVHWRAIYSRPWKLSASVLKRIVAIGWPAAFLQFAWTVGSIVLYNILGRLGDESITALAALTSGLRIEAVIFLPAFALNMAASVLVGQNLGAGDAERAERLGWKISTAATILISLMAVVIFIWAHFFASILVKNAAVLEETVRYLRINMVSEPFMAMSIILAGCLHGAGDTKGTMWIIVSSIWFIRLPLAYFLSLVMNYGAPGVWVAMVTSMVVQGILMTGRFHRGKWKALRAEE
jgi:putative MATE family efflux protein